MDSHDYETWPIRQLQDECRDRGLASGRSKADLVARLQECDVASSDGLVVAESDVPPPAAPPVVEPQEPELAVPGASVFRRTFPIVPGGLDDASHLDYRRRTWEAARADGLSPLGGELGARRAGTTPDGEVYEINLRRRP